MICIGNRKLKTQLSPGGFGYDFTHNTADVRRGVDEVAQRILAHGVTSFCPTLITAQPHTYQAVLPHIPKRPGGQHGATVLGCHVEGPFIRTEKKGAHPTDCIRDFGEKGFDTLLKTYGSLDNIAIVTLAPEKPQALAVIEELSARGITAAVGHSMATLQDGEAAVRSGSNLITHLFNAMLPVSVNNFVFSRQYFIIYPVPSSRSRSRWSAHVGCCARRPHSLLWHNFGWMPYASGGAAYRLPSASGRLVPGDGRHIGTRSGGGRALFGPFGD